MFNCNYYRYYPKYIRTRCMFLMCRKYNNTFLRNKTAVFTSITFNLNIMINKKIDRVQKHLLLIIVSICMFSCQDDAVQAKNSLKGSWKVVNIKSFYGNFDESGGGQTDSIHCDSGNLGFFNFNLGIMDFDYIRHDTIREGSGDWTLTSCKVRSGFSRETQFSLDLVNHFTFDVQFEDGTRNSEKNANSMTLMQDSKLSGYGVAVELMLEKL